MAADPCEFPLRNVEGNASNGAARRLHLKNGARRNGIAHVQGSEWRHEVERDIVNPFSTPSCLHLAPSCIHTVHRSFLLLGQHYIPIQKLESHRHPLSLVAQSLCARCSGVAQSSFHTLPSCINVVGKLPSRKQTRRGPLPWQRIPASFLYEM